MVIGSPILLGFGITLVVLALIFTVAFFITREESQEATKSDIDKLSQKIDCLIKALESKNTNNTTEEK